MHGRCLAACIVPAPSCAAEVLVEAPPHLLCPLCLQPFVYLKFGTVEAAQAAHKALNGRFYSGKQIMVEYQFVQVYNAHFQP